MNGRRRKRRDLSGHSEMANDLALSRAAVSLWRDSRDVCNAAR